MNWFTELKKYRETKNKDSFENFLSAALAGIMNADSELCINICNYMFKEHDFSKRTVSDIQRSFKVNNSNNRIQVDILIMDFLDNNSLSFVGVIECKVGSPPVESQLIDYKKALENEFKNINNDVVFLGTFIPEFHSFPRYTWIEIGNFLKNKSENETASYLRKELLSFMQDNGLSISAPLSNSWYESIENNFLASKIIESLIKNISREFVEKGKMFGKIRIESATGIGYKGIKLKTNNNIEIGLYFIWYHDNFHYPFGIAINIKYSNSTNILKKYDSKKIILENDREIEFNKTNLSWSGITCFLDINQREDKMFWSQNEDEQRNYLFRMFEEILIKSELIN